MTNPEQEPQPPGDAPRASLLDGLVVCPHCRGLIEPSADHSGQTVACPHCGGHLRLPETIELSFVPAPLPYGASPPKEPWFYGFIDTYAKVWMWLALLVTTLSIVIVIVAGLLLYVRTRVTPNGGYDWLRMLFLAAAIVAQLAGLIGVLLAVAFMRLVVDIARNVRAIRHQEPARGYSSSRVA